MLAETFALDLHFVNPTSCNPDAFQMYFVEFDPRRPVQGDCEQMNQTPSLWKGSRMLSLPSLSDSQIW